MDNIAQATVGPIIDKLRKDPTSHLLVAGGKPGLFEEKVRNLPRVVFWHSTEHSAKQSSMAVPDRVGAIVINRFLDHTLTGNLRKESRRLGIPMCNVPLGPQAIVKIIEDAGLTGPSAVPAGPVISDAPASMGRGQLRAFIRHEGRFNVASGGEIARLWELAQARGLPTTSASIASTYYQVRKDMLPPEEPEGTEEVTVSIVGLDPDPVPTLTVSPAAQATIDGLAADIAAKRAPLDPPRKLVEAVAQRDAALDLKVEDAKVAVVATPQVAQKVDTKGVIALIEDAIVALSLVKDAVASIAPTLDEAEALRAKIDKMRAFLND